MTLPSLADVRHSEPRPADEAEIEEHLQLILSSPAFEKAGTLRTLLIYLFEHRGQAISEYAVATEALGKKSDFEPKIDASVRVRISRLRQKLDEFYQGVGRDAAIRFTIPLGGHDLRVARVSPTEEPPVFSKGSESGPNRCPREPAYPSGRALRAGVPK